MLIRFALSTANDSRKRRYTFTYGHGVTSEEDGMLSEYLIASVAKRICVCYEGNLNEALIT